MQPYPTGRGSGRTQWMIDQLCDAVAEGQPKCRVLGHTMDFSLRHLKSRVIEALQKRGLKIDRVTRDSIEAEGSVILFSSTSLPECYHRGLRGWGEFVDHYADGEY